MNKNNKIDKYYKQQIEDGKLLWEDRYSDYDDFGEDLNYESHQIIKQNLKNELYNKK